ncbi:chemotaxis protein CheW [Blastococcus sp. TF02-09]|uniref:chemotaxis protein CheW n=1 Tax=Blastococcus sp. TF02-09 TaxID=2250576 RepID=UPI000DEB032E|nr:chemotaxis protein CheW [Blastococcus sp. TF02-9]RBY74967.1 chemotaxis protein CheW [Blastococcus sp. TF02-9]
MGTGPVVAADAADDVVYGLLRLAGMDVALPLSALREVVPCPRELAGLPASAPGLLGAIELRRLVLPVVDLRPLIGREDDRRPDQVVVVVAHQGQVLGLLADEVRGVTRLPAAALVAARTHGSQLLFSHTFRHPDTGRAHSVLDAAALLGRPGVPTVEDVTRQSAAVAGRGAGELRTLTVVRCGGHRFAVDAVHVHTTLPTPDVQASVLSGPACRGVIPYADREVPVVDPLVLLGLGEMRPEDLGAGLVLELASGYVVLALSDLLELAPVPVADVLALPAHATARPDLVTGIVEIEHVGDCLVLSGEALQADPELAGFASVNTAVATGPAPGDTTAGAVAVAAAHGAPSYLTFSVGVDVAVPLEQVMEILPFPASLTDTAVEGQLGVIVHRRSAVPVYCLSQLLGRGQRAPTATSCLLLVGVDGAAVAFAVEGLRTIDPLTWRDDQQTTGDPGERGATLRTSPLVQVGANDRLLPDLDLRAVARRAVAGRQSTALPQPAPVG